MRKEIIEQIRQQKELQEFIRLQPHWYRRLSRNPNEFSSLEISALHFYERTIPHQVQKFTNGVQMASMMMQMFANMNSQT
ncbi:YlbE-like family protein [Bacillus sp. B15-48]|uniref:YlbE-like family protein n=1 Tax=Bacillus sp. B15-48 TaxID=1548601 RepID=UPI00193F577A|nr:YlbE-like family protein [Bacillus sp. B15-48]MBM4764054.1 hypothetical protein [Bacillus sp. B15-48]